MKTCSSEPLTTSRLKIHEGRALFEVAKKYARVINVGLEAIQNAIDAKAQNIDFVVNFRKRSLTVNDDGDGKSAEEFHEKLANILVSSKGKDEMGRFGIGVVSSLGKCKRFFFTSTPKESPRQYMEWMFVCDEIYAQEGGIHIPVRPRPDLVFSRKGNGVKWRTQLRVEDFNRKDSSLMRMTADELTDAILDRFNQAMLKRKTEIHITWIAEDGSTERWTVTPREFQGTPIGDQPHRVWDQHYGGADIYMYLAPRVKGYKARVQLGEWDNDFRFGIEVFAKNTPAEYLPSKEVLDALSSGIFEGAILATRAKLDPNRLTFVAGDNLMGFSMAIERWYEDVGRQFMKIRQSEAKEEKYKNLCTESVRVLEELLLKADFPLKDYIDHFVKVGSVGRGHADVEAEVIGMTKGTAITPRTGRGRTHSNGNGNGKRIKSSPAGQKEKIHSPVVAVGTGPIRTLVRGNSTGLGMSIEEMIGQEVLFKMDQDEGVIRFNCLNPTWIRCEEAGEKISNRLIHYLTVHALEAQMLPDDQRDMTNDIITEASKRYSYFLIYGDKIGKK